MRPVSVRQTLVVTGSGSVVVQREYKKNESRVFFLAAQRGETKAFLAEHRTYVNRAGGVLRGGDKCPKLILETLQNRRKRPCCARLFRRARWTNAS